MSDTFDLDELGEHDDFAEFADLSASDPLAGGGLYDRLFSDPDTADLLTERAEIEAMIAVESALARVQGRLGVIPADAAMRIDGILTNAAVDAAALARGTARDGVPVPALVEALREAVGPEAGPYLHWGAASQDIVDTALMVRLRALLNLLDARLAGLHDRLGAVARAHAGTPMVARTRTQQATPTTFGLKVAGWAAPLRAPVTRCSPVPTPAA